MNLFDVYSSNLTIAKTYYSPNLTTHLPPLSNVSPLIGYISISVCVIFWGIMFLPVKHYGDFLTFSFGKVRILKNSQLIKN